MKTPLSLFFKAALYTTIILGVILRFTLFRMAFEYDELFTAITSDPSLSLGWIWKNWLVVDVHPPLYNILLWGYNHLVPFGTEVWLRAPSAVFGLSALIVVWCLFPKRFGKTARRLFLGLLACNTYVILYAQHARAYAWMLLLSLPLTFWFLEMSRSVRLGRDIPRRRWLWFSALALALAWSHYFGALLVGVFFSLLFAQAWRAKRPLAWFLWVPVVVGFLFLPWFIPNLEAQFEFQRFAGNWWANEKSVLTSLLELPSFFFFSRWGCRIMAGLLACGLGCRIYRRFRTGDWGEDCRALGLLGTVVLLVLGGVGVISWKANLFIGRYFTVLLPSVYLICVLLVRPLLRKNFLFYIPFIAVLALELCAYAVSHKPLLNSRTMSARVTSEFYRDFLRGREIMVVALEAFPPASMPALYGFYVNKVFGLNAKVTELVSLDKLERERALRRSGNAYVFMPNCSGKKLRKITEEWGWSVGVYMELGNTCVLGFLPKNSPPPAL